MQPPVPCPSAPPARMPLARMPLALTPLALTPTALRLFVATLALVGVPGSPPGAGGHLHAQVQGPTAVPFALPACGAEPAPPPVDLASLWQGGAEREPGFEAARERVVSGGLARSAVNREWVPAFQVEGLSNYGQRTSPGEERVLGVGPRSDLRLLGSWTLLDGSRSWRGREARLGETVATAGASAFARSWQATTALAWVEAAASESAVRARSDHLARIEALEIPVRRRTEAGVEAAWELHLLEEALARAERLLAEAEEARASSRVELSGFVGACVRAPGEVPVASVQVARIPVDRTPTTRAEVGGAERPGVSGPEDPDPEVRRLEALAQVREAQARAIAAGDRWQVALVGSAGPTRSRAFDPGPVEQEYVVGVSGRIGLDLAGVRRTAERAGLAEAGALRADAESLRAARERERSLLELEIDRAAVRGADLDDEVTRAEARLEAARLRWEAGVDGWNPLLQAADRALEARLLRTNWALALARSRIRLAELHGTLDALATDFSLAPEDAR